MLPNFLYTRPESVSEAIKHLQGEEARVHAGGTDLLGCLRDGVFDADKVVSLAGVNELRGIRKIAGGKVGIGALSTITEVAHSDLIKDRYPGLAQAALEVASPQLRNQGTIGGNICQKPRCWYYRGEFHCRRKGGEECYALLGQNQFHCIFGADECCIVHPSDMAPALVALQADIRIAGSGGERSVPAEKLHVLPSVDVQQETVLAPGEIVTEIILPKMPREMRSSYRKVRARQSWDFALASVALALQFEGKRVAHARVVLGGAAPVPWRSPAAEEAIVGRSLDSGTVAAAADAVVRGAEPLQHNEYKVSLFKGLIEEQLQTFA